ncbi:MAG: TraR/DksA C4-type zinc finger protein [Opitutales bacterium]|nr:TraR/DksA C4-type zinc finger protein [Opitutales bacterium]
MATSKKKTTAGDKSDKPAKNNSKAAPKGKAATASSPTAKAVNKELPKPAQGKGKAAKTDSKPATSVEKTVESIKAIASAKTGSAPAARPVKKSIVAAFTMEDVQEVLKNRREEAREKAQKIEAAARKTIPVVDLAQPQQQRVLGAATLADILGFGSPGPSAKKIEPVQAKDVPAKFKKYYDLLMTLRDKVTRKINQRGRMAESLGGSTESTLPPQNDEDDSFDHDFALSLVATEQEALVEIDAAIERINDGTYGICEITGKQIQPERLEAVPFTRYSVDGQAQFERMNRRRTQRTTTFLDSAEDASAFAGDDAEE